MIDRRLHQQDNYCCCNGVRARRLAPATITQGYPQGTAPWLPGYYSRPRSLGSPSFQDPCLVPLQRACLNSKPFIFKCTGIVITPCRHRGQGSMSNSRAQDDAAARRRDIANGTWERISHTHVVSNIKLVDRIPLDHPLPDQLPSPKLSLVHSFSLVVDTCPSSLLFFFGTLSLRWPHDHLGAAKDAAAWLRCSRRRC